MQPDIDYLDDETGARLCYRLWRPQRQPRALIVICHGAAEHGGRYQRFAERFLPLGYSVAALDLPGHGKSPGRRGHIDRFGQYVVALNAFVAHVRAEYPLVPVVLLGHSMGGLVVSCYLLQHGDEVLAAVLSAPAIQTELEPALWQQLLIRAIARVWPSLGALQLDAGGISRDPVERQAYLDDPEIYLGKLSARMVVEMVDSMARVQQQADAITVPLLLLHGDADTLTAPSGSRFLFEHAGSDDKMLKLYPGLYHEIFNEPEREQVFADLETWLGARLDRRSDTDAAGQNDSTSASHAASQGEQP
ncbi:MAG: alpha/beta hydrolase [Halieaceae bacterium]|jgi:alpha-beta hydrolase superfamily lysophospholipase|nr:alpha/beta hydrolase [Halieaceae bacterium]